LESPNCVGNRELCTSCRKLFIPGELKLLAYYEPWPVNDQSDYYYNVTIKSYICEDCQIIHWAFEEKEINESSKSSPQSGPEKRS
jgi:hypothetical protein